MFAIQQRFFVGLILAVFLLTTLPLTGIAAEKTNISLEQALNVVKQNFSIPKDYTEFSSGFQSDNQEQYWFLTWNSLEELGGSFNAQVDAQSGMVTAMNQWRNEPVQGGSKISEERAQQIATDLLQKLVPEYFNDLKPVRNSSQISPLMPTEAGSYSFEWQRQVNGIPFIGDGVAITVQGKDGLVQNYSLTWTKGSIPEVGTVVTPAQAQQAFLEHQLLELQYYVPYHYFPRQKELPQPILVYNQDHPSGGIINAQNGEPLQLETGAYLRGINGFGATAENASMDKATLEAQDGGVVLSPEEIQEIEKTADLIPLEKATAEMQKWFKVPSGFKVNYANLASDNNWLNKKVWSISWIKENKDLGTHFINANVDAITGEVLHYYSGISEALAAEADTRMDYARAQEIAEKFLSSIQPQRFAETRLSPHNAFYNQQVNKERGTLLANDHTYTFSYQQMVNGVVVPSNGLTLSLNPVTGEITGYSCNWRDYTYSTLDGALSAEQAVQTFLQNQPLTLSYVQVQNYQQNQTSLHLVYYPLANSTISVSRILDAKTGEMLDAQGKPLSQQLRVLNFTDIQGNFAEAEIRLLAQSGIFGEYGDTFRPTEKVTLVSLLRAMLMTQNTWENLYELTDAEILKRAKNQGWLKENLQATDPVTKETLAKLMVRYLNLDRAARIQGIYQVPYSDAADFTEGTLGYISIAWGLELLRGNGDAFEPQQTVQRDTAAMVLVRTLKVTP